MKMKVLINATNITGAGQKATGASLIPALLESMPDSSFSLLLPDQAAFRRLHLPKNATCTFVQCPEGILNGFRRLKELFATVPQAARRVKADVCLTLGDIGPLSLPCPSVVFLNQPLLVYDLDELSGLGSWSPLKRLYLTRHFAWASRKAAYMVVPIPVMAERLVRMYGVDRQQIAVIPLAVPDHVMNSAPKSHLHPEIAICNKPIKLLFLAAYYEHKNHAILAAVAQAMRRRGLSGSVQIFVTLDEANIKSTSTYKHIQQYPDVITNLGPLPMSQVAGALRASTALFLPTLIESFGNIYLEAMACGLPILTSDRDFARWMCRDLALYFDPLDATSIVNAIEASLDLTKDVSYQKAVTQHLATFPNDWNEVASMFADVLLRANGSDA